MAVRGLNHLTLAVGDLDRSIAFYRDLLGCTLRARWHEGAYLEAGTLWLCLSLDHRVAGVPAADYTHFAFDVSPRDFEALARRVSAAAPIWKDNRSEGASLYVLDPDGHKLELHTGSLESRLAAYRARSGSGVEIFDAAQLEPANHDCPEATGDGNYSPPLPAPQSPERPQA
ncbi:glutathione transferase [Sphingosinicella sp. BN140058]|nr:glutathione transferase [Sphingosinicella sp. BN140058]